MTRGCSLATETTLYLWIPSTNRRPSCVGWMFLRRPNSFGCWKVRSLNDTAHEPHRSFRRPKQRNERHFVSIDRNSLNSSLSDFGAAARGGERLHKSMHDLRF